MESTLHTLVVGMSDKHLASFWVLTNIFPSWKYMKFNYSKIIHNPVLSQLQYVCWHFIFFFICSFCHHREHARPTKKAAGWCDGKPILYQRLREQDDGLALPARIQYLYPGSKLWTLGQCNMYQRTCNNVRMLFVECQGNCRHQVCVKIAFFPGETSVVHQLKLPDK